jgi:probable HAF family extracellular repeat protein
VGERRCRQHTRTTARLRWTSGALPEIRGRAAKSSSFAQGISTVNGVLQVVGYSNILNVGNRAFIWKGGVITDLNSLVSVGGVTLQLAIAINTQGQIVGYATVPLGKRNTEIHGFLLTPN